MSGASKKRLLVLLCAVPAVAAGIFFTRQAWSKRTPDVPTGDVPITQVRRGAVTFSVWAKGSLQGGNSQMLSAPMTGGGQLILTELRKPGETVAKGEVVAQFDTTDEQYRLREAEADLAEAELQVKQAESEMRAKEEELNYDLVKARGDLKQAELEVRRNELLSAIQAKQNLLTLEDARSRLTKLERDYPARKAAAAASIAIQDAARKKAQVQADVARRNIEMMTLKAPASGYVNVEKNTNSNFYFPGMQFPLYQLGDQVRPGMAVAQIPDMNSWEISAKIAEQDRGHLVLGQPAVVAVIALPGREFHGKVKDLGGTTGPPWDRRFECKVSLDDGISELRPGMSTTMRITTQTIGNALYLPAQAMFEADGKKFVYLRTHNGFARRDVKLVRASESQVVVEGLPEGTVVALANPEDKGDASSKGAQKSATKAMGK